MLWDFTLNIEITELKKDIYLETSYIHNHYSHFIIDPDVDQVIGTGDPVGDTFTLGIDVYSPLIFE